MCYLKKKNDDEKSLLISKSVLISVIRALCQAKQLFVSGLLNFEQAT